MKENSNTPKAYIGTYAKYNNGSLYGAWMDLTKYANYDDFLSACHKLHKDESDPEFMCQDTECMPDGLSFPESFSRKDFEDVITAYKESLEEISESANDIRIVGYSEKAIAVYGDTKSIKDKLKSLGGRFNPRLREGAGWIFSKKMEAELRKLLAGCETTCTCRTKDLSVANEYKDALAEYCKLVNDCGYYSKEYEGAVKIENEGDTFYYLIEKPRIENSFWFHDEGPNYEYYLDVVANEESKKNYFLNHNINSFDRDIKRANKGFFLFEKNRVYFDCRDGKPVNDDIRKRIVDGILFGKERFKKRLNSYLKRWGTSKLRFETYWADR